MSHFTVLVAAKDENQLREKLQPYHEYECTGVKDQYVEWVDDIHDEHLKEYENGTIPAVLHHGEVIGTKYDRTPQIEGMWKRDGIGVSSADQFVLKEGYDIADIPRNEYFDSFDQYMNEWCGYDEKHPETGRFGRWTNLNAKWDWWVIGGRWTGSLHLKTLEAMQYAGNGRGGAFNEVNADPSRADYARAGDIDWEGMRSEQVGRHIKLYDLLHEQFALISDTEVISKAEEQKDKYFNDRPELRKATWPDWIEMGRWEIATQNLRDHSSFFMTFDEIKMYYWERQEFYNFHYNNALFYAFIDHDGEWYGRGEMGFWGMDSNRDDNYSQKFWQFVESLPEEMTVYVVDCHI